MNKDVNAQTVIATLLKREFLEFRMILVQVPAALTVLCMLWFLIWILRGGPGDLAVIDQMRTDIVPLFSPDTLDGMSDTRVTERAKAMHGFYQTLLLISFWLSMMFYYLQSLYRQRSNRSILFWNSLPVSNTLTITAKLLAGLVACHAIYLAGMAIMALFILIQTNVAIAFRPEFQRLHEENLQPLMPLLDYVSALLPMLVWSLPVYGWLLLASAWARQAPFAWAAGPWIVLILIERMLTEQAWLFTKVLSHLFPFIGLHMAGDDFPNLELALSGVIGLALIFTAVRLNRGDDN